MECPSLRKIISEIPLYNVFSVQVFKSNGDFAEDGRALLIELFHTKKVDLKCVFCEKEYPFDVSVSIKKELKESQVYEAKLYGNPKCSLDDNRLIVYGCNKFPDNDDGIIEYTLKCTMKSYHYYKVFLHYVLNKGSLILNKIGQIPSTRDLKRSYFDDYKGVLSKYDSTDDYRNYEKCIDNDLLVGACTYLRRILERIVARKLENISPENKANIKNFKDKIKLVSDQFDNEIRDVLLESYRLLCRGVHELSNKEIDEFYELLVEVINVQLESEKEILDRNQRMGQLRKNIRQKANQ